LSFVCPHSIAFAASTILSTIQAFKPFVAIASERLALVLSCLLVAQLSFGQL
jgi:hypothetical protein